MEPSYSCNQSVRTVSPGHDVEVELPSEGVDHSNQEMGPRTKPVDRNSISLQLNDNGLEFETGGDILSAETGKEYRIIANAVCPPLNTKELQYVQELILAMVEGAGPHEAPGTSRGESSAVAPAWRHITQRIGRDHTNDIVVKGVQKFACDATCHTSNRRSWNDWYDNHPRGFAKQLQAASASKALAAIESGMFNLTIYHRALDRFPGGNADMHIVKHVYNHATGTLHALHFVNWDAQSSILNEPEAISGAERITANVVPALQHLISTAAELDLVCTIDHAAMDCEEYDTCWSSIEIILSDADGGMLARLHQRARMFNQEPKLIPKPATSEMQRVLDNIEEELQLGTVEHFSNNSPFKNKMRVLDWHGYILPLYLDDLNKCIGGLP